MKAIISVSDKRNISGFAKYLSDLEWEILATGGTAKFLLDEGIKIIHVEEYTGFPEILEGRVKTLHPKILGGILAQDSEKAEKELLLYGINRIDLVACNLYPFQDTTKKSHEEAIENIDIGGVTLLRAAAKNYHNCLAVCNPVRYPQIIRKLRTKAIDEKFRKQLAKETFDYISQYDAAIRDYFNSPI